MRKLLTGLRESDKAVLTVIAQFWGVESDKLETSELPAAVHDIMIDSEKAESVWDKLDDQQHGAFQMLLAANGSQMPIAIFERVNGEIRKMGAGAIEREKPLENPTSVAEALFYRGLIYDGFEKTETGIHNIIYIPPELAQSLPTHLTTYDNLDETIADDEHTIEQIAEDEVGDIIAADTSIVDDITTLLAYLQTSGGIVEEKNVLSANDRQSILPHLLNGDEDRLTFLFAIAVCANLVEIQEERAYPRRSEARRWLEGKRAVQLKRLVDVWHTSNIYQDLWHVPGLHPEPTGWPYDAVIARQAVIGFIRDFVPRQKWWPLDELIITVKEIEPDFQRPGGDYESWYIRNDAGEYLNGFESWDAVEGALLEFYLSGPMHWLGMVDLAEDAARLTAYGRAFISEGQWPQPNIPVDKIIVQDDGTMLISRRVPLIDRFQAMRFTFWDAAKDGSPYTFKLNADGIKRATSQGIGNDNIIAFLSRVLEGKPLPQTITKLLETWQSGPTSNATIEKLMVLRTTSLETMDFITDTPALRRYLGARLGDLATVVRADQWEALRDALGEQGIDVEIIE